MGAKGSVEAAKLNADNWGGQLEVCISTTHPATPSVQKNFIHFSRTKLDDFPLPFLCSLFVRHPNLILGRSGQFMD